jgi:hypothetical protein
MFLPLLLAGAVELGKPVAISTRPQVDEFEVAAA